MIKLLIAIFLSSTVFTGCLESTLVTVNPESLKFKAGDEVTTTVSFYANCTGTIEDYGSIRQKGEPPHYRVSFYCPNIGLLDDISVMENNLALKTEQK